MTFPGRLLSFMFFTSSITGTVRKKNAFAVCICLCYHTHLIKSLKILTCNIFLCKYLILQCGHLRPNISGCQYDSTALSDHSPTSLFYSGSQLPKRANRWCLHPRWLQNSEFIKFVGEHIDAYFTTNTDQTSASTRWEAK